MKKDRREFLINSCSALTMVALATQMRHFGLMSAMAQTSKRSRAVALPSDYRALVCIFLSGGNDSNNMIVPNHSSGSVSNYAAYSSLRSTQGLALAQSALLPISVPRIGGLTYGLHPNLGPLATGGINNGIHELWAQGRLGAVTNVGTLVAPTTRTQYLNNTVKKPYQLFSHSDQVNQYQGGRSDTQPFSGWAGRISDLRSGLDNPNGLVPMITSISGAQLFTSGQSTLPLTIADSNTLLSNVLNPQGFTTNNGPARKTSFDQLRSYDLDKDIIKAASEVTTEAMLANSALQANPTLTTTFPTNTSIGRQLMQVARMISKRNELGVTRQIFFVQLGSFDTHTNQLTGQGTLMGQLGQAMRAFYDEMTAQGLSDKVTQFTMSDFNRTMNPAGSGASVGSDHAWGGHCLVLGGGLVGADFYGVNASNGTPFQTMTLNGPDDSDSGTSARGRWVPTTSIEQYAATLARWFGVPETSMSTVFPRLPYFSSSNLGFMQPPA